MEIMGIIILFLCGVSYFFGAKSGSIAMGVSCANRIIEYTNKLKENNQYSLDEETLTLISEDLINLQRKMRLGARNKVRKDR